MKRVPKPGGKKTRASDDEAAWGDLPDEEEKVKKKIVKKPKASAGSRAGSQAGSRASSRNTSDVDMSASEVDRKNRELDMLDL
jgi:hypothetical protein